MSELRIMAERLAEQDRRIAELERRLAKMPDRIPAGGGGGGTRILHVAANKTALDAITATDGHIGYTEDTDKAYRGRDSVWVEMVHVHSASTIEGLPSSGVKENDLGWVTGTIKTVCRYTGSAWVDQAPTKWLEYS